MSDPIPEDIAAALRASAASRGSIGEPFHYFSAVASTNDAAARLAERGAADGTTVVAGAQTAGRGRLGREWFSPPGAGLYASVVFRGGDLSPALTLAGGVAVTEGIQAATGLPVEIKWPNDVVIRDGPSRSCRRKLAGILAEASTSGSGVHYVVLGFGVNVRQASFPPDLAASASSLEAELGRRAELGTVLAEILAALNVRVQQLRGGETTAMLNRWRALAPLAVGATVEWDRAGGRTRGTTHGVDETGALLVRAAHGMERILSGEVRWL